MNIFIVDPKVLVRLGAFLAVFAVMASWESVAPRRALTAPKGKRWLHNLCITFANPVLLYLAFPVVAMETAAISAERGWGLLNNLDMHGLAAYGLGVRGAAAGVVSVVVLDFTVYLQHVLFHRVPLLWRLHRMHHIDMDIDVTTGARFHPLEAMLSMGIKMAAVAALGAPVWAVVVFEVLLNGTSMFNHSNIYIPPGVDRIVRLVVVTPDMHRVHHSVLRHENNSNFGFNLPWWDRLLRTYRAQPAEGHQGMTIGLSTFREEKYLTLRWMLATPFLRR